jgi:hypothetical protein
MTEEMTAVEFRTNLALQFFEELQNGVAYEPLEKYAKERYGYSVMALAREASKKVSLVPAILEIKANNDISALEQIYELVEHMATLVIPRKERWKI